MDWTKEQDAVLTALWGEGRSGSEIGKVVKKTRSAVLGRARRLKLSNRTTMKPKKPSVLSPVLKKTKKTTRQLPKDLAQSKAPVPPVQLDDIPTKTFDELDDIALIRRGELKHCRHRIDVPYQNEPYGFCGKEPVPFLPVCEQHARRWYPDWPEIRSRYVKSKTKEREPA